MTTREGSGLNLDDDCLYDAVLVLSTGEVWRLIGFMC